MVGPSILVPIFLFQYFGPSILIPVLKSQFVSSGGWFASSGGIGRMVGGGGRSSGTGAQVDSSCCTALCSSAPHCPPSRAPVGRHRWRGEDFDGPPKS